MFKADVVFEHKPMWFSDSQFHFTRMSNLNLSIKLNLIKSRTTIKTELLAQLMRCVVLIEGKPWEF